VHFFPWPPGRKKIGKDGNVAASFSRETVKNQSSAQGIVKSADGRNYDPKTKTVN